MENSSSISGGVRRSLDGGKRLFIHHFPGKEKRKRIQITRQTSTGPNQNMRNTKILVAPPRTHTVQHLSERSTSSNSTSEVSFYLGFRTERVRRAKNLRDAAADLKQLRRRRRRWDVVGADATTTNKLLGSDVRGIRGGLIVRRSVHVQRDLFPFAAAVVGARGVDRHFQLHLFQMEEKVVKPFSR